MVGSCKTYPSIMSKLYRKNRKQAQKEVYQALYLSNICNRVNGIIFSEENVNDSKYYWKLISAIVISVYLNIGNTTGIVMKMMSGANLEVVISTFHFWGYAVIGISKLLVTWHNRGMYRNLLHELADLWPVASADPKTQDIKKRNLQTLRLMHGSFFLVNVVGLWLFCLTPVAIFLWELVVNKREVALGFIWNTWHPFDTTTWTGRVLAWIIETASGHVAVLSTLGADLHFSGMASHITLLLQLLQLDLRRLAANSQRLALRNCYGEVVTMIKLHQRLIKYCKDLERAFTGVLLLNIIISSIDICCVGFNIFLLDPLFAVSNKFYLGAVLSQIGVLCWFGEYIFRANREVGDAAYEGYWYNIDLKSRQAMQLLILRSSKPITFTAMKFKDVTLVTFTSILTSAYSYFALLRNAAK